MNERNFKENEMLHPISAKEFSESGLLWLTNSILHNFGIALSYDPTKPESETLIPNITKFRGFDEKTNDDGYKKVAKYMAENAKKLLKDCD